MDRKRLAEIRKNAAPGPGNRGLAHYATEVRELLAALDKAEGERDDMRKAYEEEVARCVRAEGENARLAKLARFLRSALVSGEGWTETCERVYAGLDDAALSPTQPAPAGEPAREWHGCKDDRGHTFDSGVCETCGFDLRTP